MSALDLAVGVRRVVSRLIEEPVGVAEVAPLLAESLHNSHVCAALLRQLIGAEPVEVFGALYLDSKHRLVAWAEVSRGTLSSSLVHPREVFGPALRLGNVAALIVAHNHPSGDPEPSPEDLSVTRRLVDAGKLLGVPLLDHVIIGKGEAHVSLRERGQVRP